MKVVWGRATPEVKALIRRLSNGSAEGLRVLG